ncbi:transcriptional regulator NrdR [Sedimentibacter sp. MB31-C6]|uniref:transcriptional regulator NrdR n=1 Tax=Sedimentibacter sp. MB31-C6 TaxID=3109366 RepID=UPI002DDCC40A|nr:transcriptional regulator NrdR [Sedimentibacter sp. MB36-C1]WSI04391.1 transcriptional regulator NrdR [Sedimentibacter sp. MB36-C1]
MKCPKCNFSESKVIDTRPTDDGFKIRRRRECVKCGHRFTTYEKIEETTIVVIKKDGTRQGYNRDKIINGLIRACNKRSVSLEEIENIADKVEKQLYNTFQNEVSTELIGELVMDELQKVDDVAYVRFASVYRKFKDINTFMDELKRILDERNEISD